MARPSDWSPVDMDRDPTPGDPDEVRDLADDLQEFADDVGEALGKIRGLASERAVLDWAGLSADAFRSEFEGVPDNLTKLEDSYALCAQALHTYWPKLQTAQGMADRAVSAQADLASAQSALGDAQDWVGRAGDEAERLQREGERDNVEPPDEADVRAAARDQQAAEAAAGAARGRVDDAEERLSAARQLALDAQEMREEAARVCAQGIEEASDAGIQNRKWWEKAIKWVTDNWDTIVEVCKVIVAVLGIVVMIIGGPLAWVVLAAALVVLADTLIKYAKGEAGLLDVAFAALDCIPGMKGLTTLGGLARGLRGVASTGLRGLRQGALRLGRWTRGDGIPMNGRNACGDPVDVATGELLMSATDVELPGVLPLIIERHHISSYRAGRWFGSSWASTLDQRLVLDEHGARLFTADGMTLLYPRPIPGEPVFPVEGPRWSLSWDGQPEAPMSVHQRETGHTLHFAATPGRPGAELPLIAVTDRNNNRIQLAYDNTGAPTDIHHSGGYHLGITTTDGRVTALTLLSDPDEPTLLAYGYDTAGLLAEITNSSGLPLRFSYDEHARMSRWEDRNGYWYSYAYDEQGRCVYTTGTDRALEYRYAYDEAHRTVVTDSLGHDTVYQFNDSFQLTSQTDPLGHTTTHTWDRYDRTLTTTDPLGHTTRYEHDDHGNVTLITHPDGSQARAEYNEFQQPTTIVDPTGAVWQQSYDASGNRTVLLEPTGHRTRYTYDEHGGLATITDALGQRTLIYCDAAGQLITVTDPTGAVTRYDRDSFGRVIRLTTPLGDVTEMAWTREGKPRLRRSSLGWERAWDYDAEGNLVALRDENGGITLFEYGVFDFPVAQVDPDGARHEFVRDTELQLTRVINPQDLSWEYSYDPAGRLVREADFDGRVIRYSHDALGRVVSRTNAVGQEVTYRRDPLGEIIEKSMSDGRRIAYEHDRAGRVVRATAPGTELERIYDAVGRLLDETVNGRKLSLKRDPLGELLTRTTPTGTQSAWTYDPAGLPVTLLVSGHRVSFGYDASGRETVRQVGSLAMNRSWDADDRLVRQSLSGASKDLISHQSFTYRPDGYLTSMLSRGSGESTFTLDALGRVTSAMGPGDRFERYAYDPAGNQAHAEWSSEVSASGNGRGARQYEGTLLKKVGGTRYEHDAAGRPILRQHKQLSGATRTWRYAWDAEDRLVEVVTPERVRWRYVYDAFGRRTAKQRISEDGHTVAEQIDFTWHESTLIEQCAVGNDGRRVATTWEYGGNQPIVQSERVLVAPGPDGEMWQDGAETDRRFYAVVADLVGTPSELVDEAGEVAWRLRKNVWGVPLDATEQQASTPLRFPGQYADAETGWHYNFHRHYDPMTARYVTPDPLGLAPAPNVFTYPHNPHTWSDPLGLAAHPQRPRRLSDPNPVPRPIREQYEEIRAGRGTPRLDNNGVQKIWSGNRSNVPPAVGRRWGGSTEWEVPGAPNNQWRILQNPRGELGYTTDHYRSIKLFPAPWYPEGG
ncbi:hypothetical protein FH609_018495 [Streptomyces sp. 3MP-14]|uniref:Rhs protein n=3 Tax=Streptomyces TaxID=1883 RepID=A0A5N6A7B7_9ACTN|nr:hypothetical protein FH607_015820 [Streptomyces mimosae]KAB8175603.1 hypothetical protein FH609_018495 [Streptomyces sp. 3MP-14]